MNRHRLILGRIGLLLLGAAGALGAAPLDLGWRLKIIKWGVQVDALVKGSRAEVAGVSPQDLVIRVEGQRIKEPADVDAVMSQYAPGSRLQVEILRGTMPSPVIFLTLMLELPASPRPLSRSDLDTAPLKKIHFQKADFYELARTFARQGIPVAWERLVGLTLPLGVSVRVLPSMVTIGGAITYNSDQTTVQGLLDAVLPGEGYTYEVAQGMVNLLPAGQTAIGELNPLNRRLPEIILAPGSVEAAVNTLKHHLPADFYFGIEGVGNSSTGITTTMTLTLQDGSSTGIVLRPFALTVPLRLPAGTTLREAINALAIASGAFMWEGSVAYKYGLGPAKKTSVSVIIMLFPPLTEQGWGGP